MRRVFLCCAVAAFLLSLPFTAFGAYPEKPVTLIVASEPGGGTDTMARLFAKFAEKYFPQPFVIENRPGAGGQIGFEALAEPKRTATPSARSTPPTWRPIFPQSGQNTPLKISSLSSTSCPIPAWSW